MSRVVDKAACLAAVDRRIIQYFASFAVHITLINSVRYLVEIIYTVFQKSDAKIEITITTTNLIRIKYPLSSFNYRLSGANIANVLIVIWFLRDV